MIIIKDANRQTTDGGWEGGVDELYVSLLLVVAGGRVTSGFREQLKSTSRHWMAANGRASK